MLLFVLIVSFPIFNGEEPQEVHVAVLDASFLMQQRDETSLGMPVVHFSLHVE